MDEFTSYDRKCEKLYQLCAEANPRDRLYAYLLLDGERQTPALLKGVPPFWGLEQHLRDEYGAARYEIMIRRGKIMLLRIEIGIGVGVPIVFTPRCDALAELARLQREQTAR